MKRLYKPNWPVLKTWLAYNHYSYLDFAKKCGLSVATINGFCNEYEMTSDKTLRNIHEVTWLEYSDLIKSDIDINLDI